VPWLWFILAACSLLIWVVLVFARGAFWRLRAFDDGLLKPQPLANWPRVTAIIPARNEAQFIAQTVLSMLAQDYPGELRIVVVDDHSDDLTAKLAWEAACRAGARERVEVISAETLPPGWTGKLWAMQQGVERARPHAADYFWFTDADIRRAPDTLSHLMSRAETQRLDMVSLMVLLETKSSAEKLLIPAFLYFFLKLYPPKWVANAKSHTAGAAGGCVLLKHEALDRIGGFARIRGEVIDDCSLAAAVKQSGGKLWLGLTRQSVSLRGYSSFAEIRDLIARTAYTQLGYSPMLLAGALLGMFLTYGVPAIFTFSPYPAVWRMSLAAWALMTVTYLPTVRFYGLSPLWAPALPLAALFYSYSTWLSALRYWMGRGGQWKGRAQAPSRRPRRETASPQIESPHDARENILQP
jgi:hopene-associated glycosyltransferase HpnB